MSLKETVIPFNDKDLYCLEDTYTYEKSQYREREEIVFEYKKSKRKFKMNLRIEEKYLSLNLAFEDMLDKKELKILKERVEKIEPIIKDDKRIRLFAVTGDFSFTFPYQTIEETILEAESLKREYDKMKMVKYLLSGLGIIFSLTISLKNPIAGFILLLTSYGMGLNRDKRKEMIHFLKWIFYKKENNLEIIERLKEFAIIIRRQGISYLEKEVRIEKNLFMKEFLRLMVDGYEKEEVENLMEVCIEKEEKKKLKCISNIRHIIGFFLLASLATCSIGYFSNHFYFYFYLITSSVSIILLFLAVQLKLSVRKEKEQNILISKGIKLLSEQSSPLYMGTILRKYD